jgi:DNA-directed RNA polymerase
MVGYENLIYEDIVLPILSVVASIIRIVECIDVAQMVTPELKQFYNSISQVLGIGTTFDVLMKCAYINSLKGVKEVCDLFIKLISKVFDSIGDIFTQLINIVNWIIDSTKNSVENLQLMIENPKEINLDE